MDDEFLSLKMMVVSAVEGERELIRRAVSDSSIPIELSEAVAISDAVVSLGRESYDVVFFDSRPPKIMRQALLSAIREVSSRPLAILIGAAEVESRAVLTEGLDVDGSLAKPIHGNELTELIRICVHARMLKRALVAGESGEIRNPMRKVLEESRFRFKIDESGDAATTLQKAKNGNYDVVFLDCWLPKKGGLAALAELRQVDPLMKIVVVADPNEFQLEVQARAKGATDFLYKPQMNGTIHAVLNRVFGLARPRWN